MGISMILLHGADEQWEHLCILVDRHGDAARRVATMVLTSQRELAEAKSRLCRLQDGERALTNDLARLDRAMSCLEADRTDAAGALAELSGWESMILDDPDLTETSLARLGDAWTEESLLAELLSPQEVGRLRAYLDRPVFERLCWTKGDYVVCGACVLVALALEMLNLAWRPDSPVDREGKLRTWFGQKLHHHAPDSPIDHQGPGFGGKLHRVRSPGHDVSRFLEAVHQTATGEFRGTTWGYGSPSDVFSRANQYGNSYPEMSWTAAFVNVVVHLFCDFFSTHSLPLPLSSVVYENAGREFRIFVHDDLYGGGFNLRHVTIGSLGFLLAFLAIEVWLWMQHGSAGRKTDPVALKRYEMRSAVTGFLTGANVAGCALFRDPFLLNVPMLVAAVDSSARMLQLRARRDSWVLKGMRNLDELAAEWDRLAVEVGST